MKQTYIDVEAEGEDDSSDDAFEAAGTKLHANGYARDNFVVDDDEDEDYMEEDEAPVPRKKSAPPTRSRKLGPPITGNGLLDGLESDRREFVENFLANARPLVTTIMDRKNLRNRPFSDTMLMQMAIKNVKSLVQMKRIEGVSPEIVDAYGNQFLNSLSLVRGLFEEEGRDIEAKPYDPNKHVVNLCSDDDEPAKDDYDDTEDETEDDDDGPSGYFQHTSSNHGPGPAANAPTEAARQWQEQFHSLGQSHAPSKRAPSAPPQKKYSPKRKAYGGKGRKTSGGSQKQYFAKKNAIKAAKQRKSSEGGTRGRPAGGGPSRSGGGGGGIGLMPT